MRSAPSAARRTASSPTVSSGPIGVARWRSMSPASISSAMFMVLTPVVWSPARMDQAIGAAPLCKPARWTALERALREGRFDPAVTTDLPAPSFAGREILLAEDAPENRVIVQAHLRATGCAVDVAIEDLEKLLAREPPGGVKSSALKRG